MATHTQQQPIAQHNTSLSLVSASDELGLGWSVPTLPATVTTTILYCKPVR